MHKLCPPAIVPSGLTQGPTAGWMAAVITPTATAPGAIIIIP
jgi:hypothetical protein